MVLVYKKGSKFTGPAKDGGKGTVFPLFSLPVYETGENVELNDFQWWAPTEKWNAWLKANPRAWTAESEEFEDYEAILENIFSQQNPYEQFFNFQISSIINEGKISSFSEFSKLYEEEETGVQSNTSSRNFIKLGLAIEKLIGEGSFEREMNIDNLEMGKNYAIVVDFADDSGNPVKESRQALKFTKFRETDKLVFGDVNFSIPLGNIPDDSNDLLEKVGEYAENVFKGTVVLGGLVLALRVVSQTYMFWSLYKGARNIYKGWGKAKAAQQIINKTGSWAKLKNFASAAFKGKGASSLGNAARINLPTGSSIVGNQAFGKAGQVLNLSQTRKVAQSALKRGLISKTASRKLLQATAARAGTRAGASVAAASVGARASNPIGWILLAAQAVGSVGQQLYNWNSKKQAPKYSEVKSFSFGTFSPGNIKSGVPITVCWTDDGGAGTWGGILKALSFSKDDTRTTMNLVKIGNFKGRSVFILLDVHSKSLDNILKSNDLVMLIFNNSDQFKRGTLDNDDLSFETIAIEDFSQNAIATYFVGYSDWEDMSDAYNEAPDTMFMVPDTAPENYKFHYKDNEGRSINVEGNLMSSEELERINISEYMPIPGESVSSVGSSVGESLYIGNFSYAKNFNSFSQSLNEDEETPFDTLLGMDKQPKSVEEKPKADSDASSTEEKPKEDGGTKPDKKETTEENWEEEYKKINLEDNLNFNNEYGQIPLVIYEVDGSEFVNPDEKGDITDYKYFTVGIESLNAKQDDPISVEVTSEQPVNEPRYGLEVFKKPEQKPEEENTEVGTQEVDGEGKTKLTTHKDVNVKTSPRKTTIKDKEVEGGINIYDEFITAEDKKKFAISKWKNITNAEVRRSRNGEPQVVVLKNKFAKLGDRIRKIRKGESGFENAVEFVERVESKIKYV